MAEQGKWFKLWCSSLDDADLENLTVHEWFCWVRLGAYIKEHGQNGKIIFSVPARALLNLFRVDNFPTAMDIVKRFPHCRIGERSSTVSSETNSTVSVDIEYLNWFKYQGDFSSDRVRIFRDKIRHHETAQEERRREEKREEENTPPLPPKGGFDRVWDRYPSKTGRKAAERSYGASVKTPQDWLDLQRALENYLRSDRVLRGFVQNGSTWFNNWRDWITFTEEAKNGRDGGKSPAGGLLNALRRAEPAAQAPESRSNAELSPRQVLAGVGINPDSKKLAR